MRGITVYFVFDGVCVWRVLCSGFCPVLGGRCCAWGFAPGRFTVPWGPLVSDVCWKSIWVLGRGHPFLYSFHQRAVVCRSAQTCLRLSGAQDETQMGFARVLGFTAGFAPRRG